MCELDLFVDASRDTLERLQPHVSTLSSVLLTLLPFDSETGRGESQLHDYTRVKPVRVD